MTERKSNMELLRIFSMILIITFHYAYKGGFDFGTELSANMLLIKTCWMFGELGVNLFILTTGYFMVDGKFKWKKLILLLVEVSFYHWLTIGIACKLEIYQLSGLKNIFLSCFPVLLNRYWFITAYIIVYVLSPWLNTLIHAMSQGIYKRFLVTILLLYSIIPTIFGAFYNTTETLLYYNRLIWLVMMYFLGAYIRLYSLSAIQTPKRATALSAIAFIILVLSIIAINKFSAFFAAIGITEPAYFWPPNTVPVVCLSVGVFGLFLNMQCSYHPWINKLGSTTLGIYLLHDGVLNRWLWRTIFQNAAHQNSPLLFLHIIITATIIFALGATIDLVRQAIEKHTLQKLLMSRRGIGLLTNVKRKNTEHIKAKGETIVTEQRSNEVYMKGIIGIIFSVSFAQLSFYQIIIYDSWITWATMGLSFLCGLFIYKKTERENIEHIKSRPQMALVLLIITIALIYAMYQVKGIPNKAEIFLPFSLRMFRLRYWLIAAPALFYLLVWLEGAFRGFVHELWQSVDKVDKKIYLFGTIMLSLAVIIFYVMEPNWYLQYDKVYSIDSGWIYKNLYPQLSYYDIRHPILSIMTFPIWALIHGGLSLFVPAHLLSGLCAICVQLINVQFLLLTGIMIKILSKSRWTLLIYLASFSVILFMLFFEKYQLCIFLLVLYEYLTCKQKRGREISLVLAAGSMPTSILLFGNELIEKEPFAHKVKCTFNMAVCGVMTLVCTGRSHLLVPQILLGETTAKVQRFGLKNLPIEECAASFINMAQGIFLPLSSKAGKTYFWTDIIHGISLVGGVIFAIIVIGFLRNYNDRFIRACGVWIAVGVVLFGIFQWGVKESPLFSIYFAWAAIPLFQRGMQSIIQKMRWKERNIYAAILTALLVVNIVAILEIGKFLATL